jgi:hypothetical protein
MTNNVVYDEAKSEIISVNGMEVGYVIRTSDRESFKKCRRAWYYSSPLGKNLESVVLNQHLMFGIVIHKGMEAFYAPETWEQPTEALTVLSINAFKFALGEYANAEAEAKYRGELPTEREEYYLEKLELGTNMLKHYGKHYAVRDRQEIEGEPALFKPLAVEWKFQVPIIDPKGEPLAVDGKAVVYQVRLDMLALHEDGSVWIWDHKTAGSIDNDGQFLDLDTQMSSYLWALHIYNELHNHQWEIGGVIYNELEKAYPKPPKELKSGALSQDKRQLTTYELYLEAIEERGLDIGPYEAMLDYLGANRRDYFRRTPVRRSLKELWYQGSLVWMEASDMTSKPALYPSPDRFKCGGCDFRLPCLITNELGDVDYILSDASMYTTRKPS